MAIKDVINPPSPSKKEMTAFGKVFREGDKVMQTKTVDDVSNGDIGYITKILGSDGEQIAIIDFGDERIVEYYQSDMETVDWAYATTVHKSQGSEYKIVIFNIMEGHNIMLKRNLAYTAVTRAKTKVIIIGQKSALIQAIQTGIEDEDKRNTMLALRLRSLKQRKETTV
jgi:exodeoxyribonuclease V alpha subunit